VSPLTCLMACVAWPRLGYFTACMCWLSSAAQCACAGPTCATSAKLFSPYKLSKSSHLVPRGALSCVSCGDAGAGSPTAAATGKYQVQKFLR
jgi:hypothetical protein